VGTLVRAKLQAASITVTPQAFDVASEARTPKSAVYELTACLTAGTLVDGRRYGVGMTDGTLQRAIGTFVEDNAIGALQLDAGGRQDNATVIQFPNAVNTSINGESRWTDWNPGGSTLAHDNFLGNLFQIKCTYFMEGDWALVEFTGPATPGDSLDITGLPWAPDFVYAISHGDPFSADGTLVTHSEVLEGYAVKTASGLVQQISLSDLAPDNQTTSSYQSILSDETLVLELAGLGRGLAVTSWNSDGLTIESWSGGGPGAMTASLLIGRTGRQLWCGVPTSLHTATASAQTITEPDFTPEGYFLFGTELAAKNSTAGDASTAKWSHGVYTGLESVCVGVQAEDGVTTSDTRSISDSIIAHVVDDAGGVSWKASHSSMAATGPVISIDNPSAADRIVGLVCWAPFRIEKAVTETEELEDAARFMRGLAPAVEDEELFDETLRARGVAPALEDVEIDDDARFARGLALTEDVELDDAALLSRGVAPIEDLDVEDEALLSRGAAPAEGDVELEDEALFMLGRELSEIEEISDEAVYLIPSGSSATAATIWAHLIGEANAGTTLESLLAMFLRKGETVENMDGTKTVTLFAADDTTPRFRTLVSEDGLTRELQLRPSSPAGSGTPADIALAVAVWAYPIYDGMPAGVVLDAVLDIFMDDGDVVVNLDGSRTVTIYDAAGTTPVYQLLISADGLTRTRTL